MATIQISYLGLYKAEKNHLLYVLKLTRYLD